MSKCDNCYLQKQDEGGNWCGYELSYVEKRPICAAQIDNKPAFDSYIALLGKADTNQYLEIKAKLDGFNKS